VIFGFCKALAAFAIWAVAREPLCRRRLKVSLAESTPGIPSVSQVALIATTPHLLSILKIVFVTSFPLLRSMRSPSMLRFKVLASKLRDTVPVTLTVRSSAVIPRTFTFQGFGLHPGNELTGAVRVVDVVAPVVTADLLAANAPLGSNNSKWIV